MCMLLTIVQLFFSFFFKVLEKFQCKQFQHFLIIIMCIANILELIEMHILKNTHRISLVAQWLRNCLPVQGTRLRALVWEDPTCCGATKPVRHNTEPALQSPRATTTEPARLEPVLRNKRSHCNERPVCHKEE